METRIAEIKDQFNIFLDEAYKTNEMFCGYASMMVICSLMLTISEAEYKFNPSKTSRTDDKILIKNFIDLMTDFDWFISNIAVTDIKETSSDCLYEVRNGLAHQISIPLNTILVRNIEDSGEFLSYPGVDFCVCLTELINSTKRTMNHIMANSPDAKIDVNRNESMSRAIGEQVFGRKADGTIISGSPAYRRK